ncbi:hypothetical protein [Nannocystis bainbridge]|uniref:Lipoprotein n=1 Tax=Nannocystis bainbridge TaxID=2995303 RepID=A0ABT5DTR7_9BACT|nr:hypothetical protein [Nannocystis bainbridge]MDC0716555.1 hypothetical protein [Nannocystis bainbridge]
MSARELALACALAGACAPHQPVPEDIQEPPPREVPPVPRDSDHSQRPLRLAAVFAGPLGVSPLAGGAVAVHGPGVLALAEDHAPLASETRLLRGWPRGPVTYIGGRWPDRAFVVAPSATRRDLGAAVQRWHDGAWVGAPPTFEPPQFYSAFAIGHDGALLGLRGSLESLFGDALGPPAPLVIDRLDDGPPPPWPPLPPGRGGEQLLTFADGSVVVVGFDPSFTLALLRWSPGAPEWTRLPLPGHGALDLTRSPTIVVGRDPSLLYAHRCLPDGRPALERLSGATWQPFPRPDGGCITSLAEAPDGTLWLVDDRGLHRHRPGALQWEAIALAPVDAPGKPTAALPGGPELPPPGPEPLTPRHVLALDRGEVWVVAAIGDPDLRPARHAVLTTRSVLLPLNLKPPSEGTGQPSSPP